MPMNTPTITIHAVCMTGTCDGEGRLTIKQSDWHEYLSGAMVQNAFPYLTPEQREFYFISGICDDCQTTIFGEDY